MADHTPTRRDAALSTRQLLERAAAAAGLLIKLRGYDYGHPGVRGEALLLDDGRAQPLRWNPLHNNDQALYLAAVLRIPVWYDDMGGVIADQRACGELGWRVEFGVYDDTHERATRRAIVLAAAARVEQIG